MRTSIYLFVFLLPLYAVSQNSINLEKKMWQRVQSCYSLFEDFNEDGVPEYNKTNDVKNGYLKVFGDWPTCGCSCNSTVGAFKDINGSYTLLQKEEFLCEWKKEISSNKKLDEILPENFDLHAFSNKKIQSYSEYAIFFLDVEIPRFGTDTKFTLKLIPFGIFKKQQNSIIAYEYSQSNPEKDGWHSQAELISSIKYMVSKMVDQNTIPFLLNKEYNNINITDKNYIEQNVIGNDSWGGFESFDELTKKLIQLKNAYDIYCQLDYMSIMMQWNKEIGRFEIKYKSDEPKNLSFKKFLLENKFWGPMC